MKRPGDVSCCARFSITIDLVYCTGQMATYENVIVALLWLVFTETTRVCDGPYESFRPQIK